MDRDRKFNATSRMLELIMLITNEPKQWTSTKLACHFQANQRTIQRDISILKQVGIDIRPFDTMGYYITQESRLPPATVLPHRVWIDLVPHLLEFMGGDATYAAKAWLDAVLPTHVTRTYSSSPLSHRIFWSSNIGSSPTSKNAASLTLILQAMYHNHTVNLTYQAPTSTEALVTPYDPYCIIMTAQGPYLSGYCHARLQKRTFKVSRIKEIEVTKTSFQLPDNPSADWDPKTLWGIDNDGSLEQVKIKFQNSVCPYVLEELQSTHLDWKTRTTEDGLVITLQVKVNTELSRWILQYGSDAEVIAPPSFRDHMHRHTMRLAQIYESPTSHHSPTKETDGQII